MIWLLIILLILIVLTGYVMYVGIGNDSGKGISGDIVDNMSGDSYDITRKKAKYRVVFSPESQKRFIDNKGNVRDTVIPTY
jgi:hypothetical protein